MKRKDDIFSIIIIFIIFIFGFLIYKGTEQHLKFKKQKTGVCLQKFKSEWGDPNRQIIDKSEIILFYDSNIIDGDYYVFKFDKTTNALIFKYYDD